MTRIYDSITFVGRRDTEVAHYQIVGQDLWGNALQYGSVAMTETMQTTLAEFEKGDEIVFNDRSQALTVTSVHDREYKSGNRSVSVYVEGPRGGEYKLSARSRREPTVSRNGCTWSTDSEWVDEEPLESVELVTPAADVEPPTEVGAEYKKICELDFVSYTGEATGYRVASIDRESQEIELAIVAKPPSQEMEIADSITVHYQDFEDRLERGTERVDDLASDPDVVMCDDGDDDPELVADGGQTVDDVAEGDVIELANGARFRVESIREHYTEPDEYRVAKVGGEKRISWRTHHVETALATGAEVVVDDGALEETGDGWSPEPAELRDGETRESSHASVARDMLADHHRELVAEGQEESDDDSDDGRPDGGQELVSDGGWVSDAETEWCPECQRERVSCRHMAGVAADGGFTTPEPASERMDEHAQELAEELADETSLKRREAEVFVLKDRGLSHAEIAEELEIAKSTVDEYSRRINDRIERAQNMMIRAGHRAKGIAPDRRPVDDISAIEECPECGDAPAPIILSGDGWECYGCGADV